MQVFRSQATRSASAAPGTRRAVGSGFALAEGDSPTPAAAGAPHTIGGIDALIALQGVQGTDDPLERRKRAVRHGREALDSLEELKLSILSGRLAPAALSRLQSLAAKLRLESGDPRLDGVLGEIFLRAEVELAKAGIG